MKTLLLPVLFSAAALSSLHAQAPSTTGATSTTTTVTTTTPVAPMAAPRDGFTMRGTEVMMSRNGITALVDREVALTNGLRVQPNGNVLQRDGTTTVLRANQLLTFAGEFEDVALTVQGVAPMPPANAAPAGDVGLSSRDGISMSGADVFITRNGVTEALRGEAKLTNGVIAKPDGSMMMTDGTKVMLRSNQVLGLDGVLREAPVRPNQGAPLPSSGGTTGGGR